MQATVVWATRAGLTAEGVVRDASGNVISSPSPTPIQHDALRFIRMSRTSDYLYDSYRNMFLALESLLADIAPQQPGEREAAWFTRALGVADNLAPAADLAPPNETDPITWAYDNIYRPKRSGLMHAKRDYLLPQDETARHDLTESLETLSNYVDKLVEAHQGVDVKRRGGMSNWGREMLEEKFLKSHKLFLSDDMSRADKHDETMAPARGSKVLEASPSNFTMVDRWYGRVEASWDRSELAALDVVGRMGAFPANGDPGGVASDLPGPLVLGSSVFRFEMLFGTRIFGIRDSMRHFPA